MKIPEAWKDKHYITMGINTISLTGLSLLWAVMLDLISPWWLILSVVTILSGYGNEIKERNK
ncbi:hypothetical protein N9245_00410 [bacterium]|nr:hypothetical protein [bacterium]